jgi:hypothetical protein
MIEDRQRVLKIFRYCIHHAVPFFAKCEDLIYTESTLRLSALRRVPVKVKTPFEEWARREVCLIMRGDSASFRTQMAWSCQNFSFSFQHRTISHSFHSKLLLFNYRAQLAVFSFPRGLYTRRLRETLRIPVSSSDDIRVAFNDQTLEVFNLTMDGVGLYLPSPSFFRIGQSVQRLTLLMGDERFLATGRIRHISTLAPGKYICGMSLEYKDGAAGDSIREFIVEKQLMSAGVSPSHRMVVAKEG